MNFKNILTLLFVIPLFSFGQKDEDINRLDSKGKRHGLWEKRYESGRLRYRGKFFHGKETGDFYFYENKIINNFPSIKKFFIKGTNVADVIFYDIYGKLQSDGQMVGKKRMGVWRYYNNKGDVLLTEEYNQEGILNGKKTVFFSNGKVAEEKTYANGKLHGISTRFSKRGIKLHEMTYENGLLHGRTVFYEVDGNRKESGLYYKDYKVGKWDYYIDGEYMGFKEPNKKRDRPNDAAIMASIEGKKEKKRDYGKLSDAQIMKNIEAKKIKDEGYDPLTDDEILASIESKRQKDTSLEMLSDKEILRNIEFKKKAPKREYSKLTDDQILKNMSRKMDQKIKEDIRLGKAKSLKKEKKIKKLTDKQILENIKKKNGPTPEELRRQELAKKIKKLSDKEILNNIKNKTSPK